MAEPEKRIVLFPGGNYTADMPLLYYARCRYEAEGYSCAALQYDCKIDGSLSMRQQFELRRECAARQLRSLGLAPGDELVFVSKSIGTVLAGWAEEEFALSVRHIVLTPLPETLPYLTANKQIRLIAAGTADRYMDSAVLRRHCEANGLPLLLFPGAGHRLEVPGDLAAPLEILRRVTEKY